MLMQIGTQYVNGAETLTKIGPDEWYFSGLSERYTMTEAAALRKARGMLRS